MANTEFLRALSDAGAKAHVCVPSETSDQWFTLPALGGATQGTAVALAIAGAGGDMLSPLINAENNLTTAGTALISTWNHCTATSANYALTLPAVASNYGKFLGVIIDPSSTYLVTVTGNASENIDSQNTRIMWAGEVAILYADQASAQWIKVGGKTRPMSAALSAPSNQTFGSGTPTKLNFTTSVLTTGPAALVTAASAQFNILRPALYQVDLYATTHNGNTSVAQNQLYIYNAAAQVALGWQASAASTRVQISAQVGLNLAAGATILPYGYYDTGSYATSFLETNTPPANQFTIQEIPSW